MTMRVGSGSSAPRPPNSDAKVGMTFQRMTPTTTAGDDDDRDRIDHRRLHLAGQLDGLLDVGREPLENRVENAARLAGGDHVGEERIEGLRVLAHRVGERRARLRRRVRVCRMTAAKFLSSSWLPRMSRHCTSGRPASIITENCRVNTARFFAETFLPSLPTFFASRPASALRLRRRDARDEDLLAPERRDRRVHRVGHPLAADRLPAARAS